MNVVAENSPWRYHSTIRLMREVDNLQCSDDE